MPRIQRFRRKIIDRDYFISSHAEDELLDDRLSRFDVENAVLKGRIEKKLTEDFRGTRYRIEGPSLDGRRIHVVLRHTGNGDLIIITTYVIQVKF